MTEAADPATESKRVLLVEDSSVTKDLVELVLTQSGHAVISVDTGQKALDALRGGDFDVVLTDFHLPDFSGLEVVRRFLPDLGDRPRPLFVAITGDTRGLLRDENCELFDRVVPKPLDIDLVCELVVAPPLPAAAPPRPATGTSPAAGAATDGLGLALLEWPPAPGPGPAPGLPDIDAILVRDARALDALWAMRGANLLPVLDATGTLGGCADIDASVASIARSDQVRQVVAQFHERRAALHPDLVRGDEPADRLLARIAVAGGDLTPRLSHRHEGLVAWNTICDPEAIPALMSRLAADDLVRTAFFERVHTCPSCHSARVVVREECPSCQGTHLSEESYLHHFRCATQALERDFVQGSDLVCPKCRRTLQHFGRDYDRPGNLISCEGCGDTTTEPQVGFVCTRCTTRTAADAMPTRDVLSATLTEAGRTYLASGAAFLGPGRRALRFGDFPLELVIALNAAAARFNEAGTPFTLVAVQYDGLDDIRREHGARRARDSRRLWLEAARQALGDRVTAAGGGAHDFLLLDGARPDAAAADLDRARQAADRTIRDDLRVSLRPFAPEDIAR